MGAIYRNGVLYTSGPMDTSVLSNYYTKTQVDNLLAAIHSFDIEIATSLLTIDNPNTHTLYLILSGDESNNVYTEYIYIIDPQTEEGSFEKIGTQTLDLSYTNASLSGVTTVTGALDALVSRTDKYFVVTGSKATNSNTVTIQDSRITANSLCHIYTADANLMYTNVVPTAGSVTITFDSYTHNSAIAVSVAVVNP